MIAARAYGVGSALLAAVLAAAALPPGHAPPRYPTGEVWITALDGSESRLPLEGWSTDPRLPGVLRFEGLAARPVGSAGPELALELRGGERVAGVLTAAAGEELRVAVGAELELVVGLDGLASLRGPAHAAARELDGLAPAERGDRLHVWVPPLPGAPGGGAVDQVDGTLLEFGADGVRFEGPAGTRSYAWPVIAALSVEALEPASPARGQRAVVELRGGSRLRGEPRSLGAAGLELVRGGTAVAIPLASIAELWLLGDPESDGPALLPLSDLVPTEAEPCRPFGDDLGMVWPPRLDLAVTGGPLAAGGRSWPRGLGMHAPSRMSFALDGRWTGFFGHAAVDDEALRLAVRGALVCRVLVDGAARWESPLLEGGDAPARFALDGLAGARVLTLEVDAAERSFAGDRADWLGPTLVRR